MNILLILLTIVVIGFICLRFKKKKIEEKDFWTILVILYVAILGLVQIQLKYEAIVRIEQNLQKVVKISVKNIAHSAGRMNRWADAEEKLLYEKEVRKELDALLEEIGSKREEKNVILSDLDYWIELDEREILRKKSNR
jgi:hypothetical protein